MASGDHPADHKRPAPVTDSPHASQQGTSSSEETLIYRRAPKLTVFLILGGALGAVLGMFVGVVGPGNVMFTTGQVVGYMIVIFTILGFSVGAVVALIMDRVSISRAREINARMEQHASERSNQSRNNITATSQRQVSDDPRTPEPGSTPRPDVRD